MKKKIRINGYDTNALTRQESLTDKKKIKGYNSQTYQKGKETKQKMQIALEEDSETLEQIEDMLSKLELKDDVDDETKKWFNR